MSGQSLDACIIARCMLSGHTAINFVHMQNNKENDCVTFSDVTGGISGVVGYAVVVF